MRAEYFSTHETASVRKGVGKAKLVQVSQDC